MDPINRPDGRHWCNPASADPADSPVTCLDCGQNWEFDGEAVWEEMNEVGIEEGDD